MSQIMQWMEKSASLIFTLPDAASHKDPRLGPLFDQLKEAMSSTEADPIEQSIWRIWSNSGDMEVDTLMAKGIVAMARERFEDARDVFDEIVRMAPEFAEGWNKRATLNYLTGDFKASVADVEKTLMLEPRHFGALSGLGLISLAIGEDERALEAFEAVLAIHPRMSVADSHIRGLREKLHGRIV
ncbi:MAG: tetratricopeptide repeat protein [Alphaproteobacteria bacterium]